MFTLSNYKRKKGFTVIELLIVITIFTVVTTIALFDQGRLNSNVLLTNLAYDVALTVREAQSYGVGVKYSSTTGAGYGVHLDKNTPDRITIFQDIISDGVFDEESGDVPEKVYQFLNQRGNQVAELCIVDAGNSFASDPSCSVFSNGKSINNLDISFKRPDPEANFRVGGTLISGPIYIVLKSPDGTNCRAVGVEGSGQVRVEGSDSKLCMNPVLNP